MKLEEAVEILEERLTFHGVQDYLEAAREIELIYRSLNFKGKSSQKEISETIRTKLLKKLSELILTTLQKESSSPKDMFSQELVEYTQTHYTRGKKYQLSNITQLLDAIIQSRLAFIGDLHYVKETKKTLIKLMEALLDQGQTITLGLESIMAKQQELLEAYQQDDLTYDEFIEELISTGSEYFMIHFNKEIYEFARENKIKLLALDTTGTLEKRDQNMALTISQELKQDKNITIVFAGSGHVAKQHLPLKTQQISRKKGIIIYQNLPSIYYKLLSKGIRPENEIARLNQQEFSIFNLNPLEEAVSIVDYKDALLEETETPESYRQNAKQLYQALLKLFLITRKDYFNNRPYYPSEPCQKLPIKVDSVCSF